MQDETTEAQLPEQTNPKDSASAKLIVIDDSDASKELPIDFSQHRYEIQYRLLTRWAPFVLSAILAPFAIFCLATPLLHYRSPVQLVINLSFGIFLAWLSWAIHKNPDAKVQLSKDGISFVNRSGLELLNRTSRTWEDVHSIKLEENQHSNNQIWWFALQVPSVDRFKWTAKGKADTAFSFQIDFISGGNASIPLDKLTRAQCRCLFLAIECWVEQSKLDKNVIKLKHAIISDNTGGSYTDIWMQDLEQRYAITNFTPLVVGHRLSDGDYTVVSILSTRGQTAVYLAQDRNGKQFVVKEIVSVGPDQDPTKEKAREMFHRQSEILIKLHHPQIARVVDCFVDTGRDYLVLEYIPGKTLRQLVKVSGPRTVSEVETWLGELLDILTYLHECTPPIVHRDLTPDNIVLKTDGSIAVIDFGAANEFLGTATGTLVGKQSYVSPEQFRGKAEPASDIYSLGATAYFLITGKDPTPLSELKPSALSAETTSEFDEFVAQCTRFDTAERFASAKAAREFLQSKQLARK
jgi:tRNA A-37 threonylcarbamoyl transferase component Bud32